MEKKMYHIHLLHHGNSLWSKTGYFTPLEVLAEANKCWENRKEICPKYDFDSIEIIDCARLNSDMEVIKRRLKKAKEGK